VLINDDGSVQTKAEFLRILKQATGQQQQQVSPESISVNVYGNIAVATGVFRAKGKNYVRPERFVDTWLLRNGNWVCVATNAVPILH
jgi:hypothetical protein